MGESTRGWIDLDDYDPGALEAAYRLVDELHAHADSRINGASVDVRQAELSRYVRLPSIRTIGRRWLKAHQDEHYSFIQALSEILWNTESREESLLALYLIYRREDVLTRVRWALLERWSGEVNDREVGNALGAIGALVLSRQPSLITNVQKLAASPNVSQRRFGLVTLIFASREYAWRESLRSMVDRLANDEAPEIQGCLDWAHMRLA